MKLQSTSSYISLHAGLFIYLFSHYKLHISTYCSVWGPADLDIISHH